MKYEWDVAKALRNRLKHGVSFAEAVTAFNDVRAITIEDIYSDDEARFITVGLDAQLCLLIVVFMHGKGVIRIISARKASKKEVKAYEKRVRL